MNVIDVLSIFPFFLGWLSFDFSVLLLLDFRLLVDFLDLSSSSLSSLLSLILDLLELVRFDDDDEVVATLLDDLELPFLSFLLEDFFLSFSSSLSSEISFVFKFLCLLPLDLRSLGFELFDDFLGLD